jgi:hypothetical protein
MTVSPAGAAVYRPYGILSVVPVDDRFACVDRIFCPIIAMCALSVLNPNGATGESKYRIDRIYQPSAFVLKNKRKKEMLLSKTRQ